MSENTKIEWATHTFNPWEGCQKVGPGCDHCYAENRNARFAGGTAINWGPGAPRRRTSVANWAKPLKWNANHEAFFATHGHRQRVFCASLADVFDNEVDPAWRADLFELIEDTPNLDWLLLTKRIGNVRTMLIDTMLRMRDLKSIDDQQWPWPNVWLGATIVNQEEADRDIPKLLDVPAAKRFLSIEPLLGQVMLPKFCSCGCMKPVKQAIREAMNGPSALNADQADAEIEKTIGIDWVIVGGESGPNARPMHPDWARSLRDQCQAAAVPYLFKQWGSWLPCETERPSDGGNTVYALPGCGDLPEKKNAFVVHRENDAAEWVYVDKKAAGRLLDGREWNGVPA